jgi:hypothetical protein
MGGALRSHVNKSPTIFRASKRIIKLLRGQQMSKDKKEYASSTHDLAKRINQIQAELKEDTTNKKQKVPSTKEQPKLFVNGKLDRKKHNYIMRSLALLPSIHEDIKKYCRGGDNAILNYLLQEGLKNVKASNTMINVNTHDIENSD